jgi:hypothetical protein
MSNFEGNFVPPQERQPASVEAHPIPAAAPAGKTIEKPA